MCYKLSYDQRQLLGQWLFDRHYIHKYQCMDGLRVNLDEWKAHDVKALMKYIEKCRGVKILNT